MGEQVKEIYNWARRRKIMAAFFVSLTLVVGILIGTIVSGRTSAVRGARLPERMRRRWRFPILFLRRSSFSGIVNRVEPAVVNIATTQVMEHRTATKRSRPQTNDQDDPMQDFFDKFFDGQKKARRRPNAALVPA